MKYSFSIVLIFAVALISGCVKQRSVVIVNNKEYQSCVMMCKKRLESCKHSCRNNCRQCRVNRCRRAGAAYCRYVHEEVVKGGYVVRQPDSYKDPLACKKTSCNCCADFNVCIQGCSGTILKFLKPGSACC